MTKDEALEMAIEALELCDGNGLKDYDFCIAIHKCKTALNACKEALDTEQVREDLLAQEPVAWFDNDLINNTNIVHVVAKREPDKLYNIPVYTSPIHPLSDEEINVFINPMPQNIQNDDLREFARAIEKAHGIGD